MLSKGIHICLPSHHASLKMISVWSREILLPVASPYFTLHSKQLY
jgi:hypothetical protein